MDSQDISEPQSIIVICGNAGVGKTTLARRLARATDATLFDIDASTAPLVQAGLAAAGMDIQDRDSPRYKQLFREPIHDALFSACREQIRTGVRRPIVVVAPFTKERRRPGFPQHVRNAVAGTGGEAKLGASQINVTIVIATCNEQLRIARIQSRGNSRDANKFAASGAKGGQLLGEYAQYSSGDPNPYPYECVVVDTAPKAPALDGVLRAAGLRTRSPL